MNGPNPMQILQFAIKQRPDLMNNPQFRSYAEVIQRGDPKEMEELGRNLCNTYNTSPENAFQMAQNRFNRFGSF